VDHGQGGGGQTEHQDRVEAGGQQPCGRVAGGEAGELSGDDVAGGGGVVAVDEPDVGVDDVVQSDRNQQTVDEAVDECADDAGATYERAHPGQPGVEDRIEVAEREAHDQAGQGRYDRYEASAPEESQIWGQLNVVVAVEQPRRDQTDGDAGEDAVVDDGLVACLVDHAAQHDRRHGLEDGINNQVAGSSRHGG